MSIQDPVQKVTPQDHQSLQSCVQTRLQAAVYPIHSDGKSNDNVDSFRPMVEWSDRDHEKNGSFHDLGRSISLRVFGRRHFQVNSTKFHLMIPKMDVNFGSQCEVILSCIP